MKYTIVIFLKTMFWVFIDNLLNKIRTTVCLYRNPTGRLRQKQRLVPTFVRQKKASQTVRLELFFNQKKKKHGRDRSEGTKKYLILFCLNMFEFFVDRSLLISPYVFLDGLGRINIRNYVRAVFMCVDWVPREVINLSIYPSFL